MVEVTAGALAALAMAGLGIGWRMWRRAVAAEIMAAQFEELYLDALRRGDGQAQKISQMEGIYRLALQRNNKLEATNRTLRAAIRKMVVQADKLRLDGWLFSRN